MALGEMAIGLLNPVFGTWSGNLLLIVLLLVTWIYYRNPARHAPPGPTIIPMIGHVPFLFGEEVNGKYLMELSQKYRSPIISIRICGLLMTIVNDYDLMKEVFAKRADVADRNTNAADVIASLENFERDTDGIVFASGRPWKHLRRFTVHVMRDFGMGKLSGEDNIQYEAAQCVHAFSQYNGQPFDPEHIIMMAVSNVTNQCVMGKRFEYADENFHKILKATKHVLKTLSAPVTFLFPNRFARMLVKSQYNLFRDAYIMILDHVQENIKEHQSRYDGTVRDLIDAYLKEMETTDDKEMCNVNTLRNLVSDLHGAGAETSSSTLEWALLALARHQDIQEKVYQELDSVLGYGGVPSMSGKKSTPYTEAVLCEIQRFHTLGELGLPHANVSEDIEINGYIIPKNTMINPNVYAAHHDSRFWKKPNEFYPENFLDDAGKVTNVDKLIPFSIGRRSCACEALARTELYIFFATWVKTFHVKFEADDKMPDMRPIGNAVKMPRPFNIRLYLRSTSKKVEMK